MKKLALIFIFLCSISGCKHKHSPSFFTTLSKHCGKTYIGETVFPNDPDDDFTGKKLIMNIKECSATEIRVPFQVGENTSRTWIITKTEKGLLLKHDHRHADGTPDEITMYGGYANQLSTATVANFAADNETAKLIPDAKTNVWSLSFDENESIFTYYLERHSKPRYKAIFHIK